MGGVLFCASSDERKQTAMTTFKKDVIITWL